MTTLTRMLQMLCLVLFSAQVNAQIVWEAPTIVADSGEVIGVDFTIAGYENVISAQGTIQFDETILEFSHVDNFALTSMSSGSFGTTEVNIGLLSFSWYELSLIGQTIANNDTVLTVFFTVVGNPGEASSIELINQPVIVEFVDSAFASIDTNSIAGSVTVYDPTASSPELTDVGLEIFPNPANEWMRIHGNFNGLDIEVKWFTMDGSLKLQDSFKAIEEIKIPLDGFETGMYYLQVGNESIGFEKRLIQIL